MNLILYDAVQNEQKGSFRIQELEIVVRARIESEYIDRIFSDVSH